jgi:hypothetical protein
VNTSRNICLAVLNIRWRHSCQIYYEVPDLTIKLVLVDVPLGAIGVRDIWVCIDQGDAAEIGRAFDGRLAVRVSDKLSIIVPNLLFMIERNRIRSTYCMIGELTIYVPA